MKFAWAILLNSNSGFAMRTSSYDPKRLFHEHITVHHSNRSLQDYLLRNTKSELRAQRPAKDPMLNAVIIAPTVLHVSLVDCLAGRCALSSDFASQQLDNLLAA